MSGTIGNEIRKFSINEIPKLLEFLEEEDKKMGVIYRITNTLNGKGYYGQAKCYILNHGRSVKHGAEGRLKTHIKNAINGKDHCFKLYAAIRKYGPANFVIKQVDKCSLEMINDLEMHYINTNNSHIDGYNIAANVYCNGSNNNNNNRIGKISNTMKDKWENDQKYKYKTSKANLASIKERVKDGAAKTKNIGLPNNIYKRSAGKSGYDIRIIRDGKMIITSIQAKDKSEEELLQLAIEKRDRLMNRVEDEGIVDRQVKKPDHNGIELPKCISMFKDKKGNEGYKIEIKIKGKLTRKFFTDKNLSMDDKLEKAKNGLAEIKEE